MSKETIETLVIGSGPGGYVAAIRAAQLGQKVTIVEKDQMGGVCLNIGCIPSKALITAGHRYQESISSSFLGLTVKEAEIDFTQTQKWKDEEIVKSLTTGITMLLKKNNVKIIKGHATLVGKNEVVVTNGEKTENITFKHAILATGSRPIEIKGFPFGERIIDSTGGLNLKEIPKHLVIIGGGVIGSELGGAYANLGSKVTIIEGAEQLLPSYEKDLVKYVEQSFKKKGVTVHTGAKAISATPTKDGVTVTYDVKGKLATLEADYVMVTVGRKPNTDALGLAKAGVKVEKNGLIPVDLAYKTSVPNILAIGDIVEGLALAHKASYDAKIAAEVISGKNTQKDYQAMPAICFTDPELASTGLTLHEAKEQKIKAKAYQFPLQGNGRALSLNQNEGFVRLVVDESDQTIIGGQIVGVNASDTITEITVAVESNLTVEDIALTVHGHPTLSEAIMDTAELAQGLPIHM